MYRIFNYTHLLKKNVNHAVNVLTSDSCMIILAQISVTSEMEYLQVVWYNSLNNGLRDLVYITSNHPAVDVMLFTHKLA
jgi:hypothetical protein